MKGQYTSLPEGLPVPVDDGSAAHLQGMALPNLLFDSTSGEPVNIASFDATVVLYIYPMTGRPGIPLPNGWDAMPGARGCTPQACDFSDHYQTLQSLNAVVFGLSSQSTDYQSEFKNRLHLPFDLLSDTRFAMKEALKLPIFEINGAQYYKRLTSIVQAHTIQKVFYPVFPSNEHASQVVDWLRSH